MSAEVRDRIVTLPSNERPEQMLAGLVETLRVLGLPLWRASTTLHAIGPEFSGLRLVWTRSGGATVMRRSPRIISTSLYKGSPVEAVIEGGAEVWCRLDGPVEQLPYPVLRELAEAGGTDYLCLPLDIPESLTAGVDHIYWRRSYLSLATDDPAGFSDEQVGRARELLPVIAARFALEASKETARQLLRAYLGANATRRILGGAFERGGAETIRAVLWYCDMRGFTVLSDSRPAHEVVRVLDAYFDAVASPVDARGGEVLKFIGDAVLGIFPLADDPVDACRRALAAVADARANLAGLNAARAARGEDALELGIALHAGDVSYGNIGAQNRLDFTVIGAPVNEVCRVEAMTRTLGEAVLMTATYVALAGLADAVPLGAHRLKGVGAPVELYTIRR